MAEWKEYKLGDVCDFQEGYVNPPQGNPEYFDGDVKWLRATDLNDGYVYSTTRTLTQLGFKSARKSAILFKPGTIAISKSGTIGRLGILQDYMCGNRAVINIIPHHTVNTYFVFLVLRSYQRYFPLMAVGSVQKNLYISILEDLKINLPDLNTQDKIVSILSSLDDKIELNRKINANLEAQAQALFKSWFVDFEPFKDQPFVESELGRIPEGWKVNRIEDLSQKMASGGTPKSLNKDYYSGDIKWFSTKELKDCFLYDSEKHISEEALNNSSAKMFPEGTVLMAIYAAPTVGRLGILTSNATFNQAAVGIVPKAEIGSEFIYLSLLSERINLNNLASGAAQQNLNVGIVKNYKIIVPSQNILSEFNKIVKSIFESIKINTKESQKLASLHDALLPRLMSGELKVIDINI